MNLTLASSRESTLAAAFEGIVETWCGEDQATILRVCFLRRALGFEIGRPMMKVKRSRCKKPRGEVKIYIANLIRSRTCENTSILCGHQVFDPFLS